MKFKQFISLGIVLTRCAAVHHQPSLEVSLLAGDIVRDSPEDKIVLRRPKLPENGVWVHANQNRSAQTAVETKVRKESQEEPAGHEALEHEVERAKEDIQNPENAFQEQGLEATEAFESQSFALSAFLMGSVGSLMCVLHLLHWPTETGNVKATTLSVLNMTFSIFVAVLVYGALKATLVGIFEPGQTGSVIMTLVLFVVLYTGAHWFLFRLKGGDPINLTASSTILAHITGFAAMYGFSDLQEVEFFEEHGATGIVMVMCIAAVVISFIAFTMSKVISGVASADGSTDEDEERWMEVCKEADDDVVCLAVSFLLVGLLRYVIRGKNFPYEPGKVGNVTQHDCNQLLGCGLCSFLLVAIGGAGIYYHHVSLRPVRRVVENFQHLTSMLTAWVGLFYSEWQLYVWGWESTIIGGCLIVACCVTFFSLAGILVLNVSNSFVKAGEETSKMLGKAMRSGSLALGVLVGFSWERAFDVAFEEIALKMEKSRHHLVNSEAAVVFMSIILFAVVAPAWRFYILPSTIEEEQLEDKEAAA